MKHLDEQRAYEEQNDNSDNDDCDEMSAEDLTAEQLSKIIGMVENFQII